MPARELRPSWANDRLYGKTNKGRGAKTGPSIHRLSHPFAQQTNSEAVVIILFSFCPIYERSGLDIDLWELSHVIASWVADIGPFLHGE